jgi:hypothetical protein
MMKLGNNSFRFWQVGAIKNLGETSFVAHLSIRDAQNIMATKGTLE